MRRRRTVEVGEDDLEGLYYDPDQDIQVHIRGKLLGHAKDLAVDFPGQNRIDNELLKTILISYRY